MLSAAVLIGLILSLTELQVQVQMMNLQEARRSEAKLLAYSVENRIARVSEVLEATSRQPEVRSTESAALISETFMGVPPDRDVSKRAVARAVLDANEDLASIFFLMPNGDIYLGEPYTDQAQLPRLNYADRDWYTGVTTTGDTYVSEVFISAAIHRPAIAIAVPTEGEDGSVVGYWVGIMNPATLQEDFLDLGYGLGPRITIVDHNAIALADSGTQRVDELKSFGDLASVHNALEGQTGFRIETINGTKTFVVYHPLRAQPHSWAAILMAPYDDVFSSIDSGRTTSYVLAVAVGMVFALTGFLVSRSGGPAKPGAH